MKILLKYGCLQLGGFNYLENTFGYSVLTHGFVS